MVLSCTDNKTFLCKDALAVVCIWHWQSCLRLGYGDVMYLAGVAPVGPLKLTQKMVWGEYRVFGLHSVWCAGATPYRLSRLCRGRAPCVPPRARSGSL